MKTQMGTGALEARAAAAERDGCEVLGGELAFIGEEHGGYCYIPLPLLEDGQWEDGDWAEADVIRVWPSVDRVYVSKGGPAPWDEYDTSVHRGDDDWDDYRDAVEQAEREAADDRAWEIWTARRRDGKAA